MAGSANTQRASVIKVTPITRAVRAALAVSAAALALTGSGMAVAGTCTAPASNTIHCNGTFTDTITFPNPDLTLIVGDSAPTSVTPAAGNVGIEANWPGMVNVTSYADILTDGADGLHAYGSASAQVANNGSIYTAVTIPGAIALDVTAAGDVGISNTGSVVAYSPYGYDVTAVRGESFGSGNTVNIDNSGDVVAVSPYGTAIGIYGYATDSAVDISNSGTITAISGYGVGDGIFASGTSVHVDNSGSIYAAGAWAAGIEAQGSDLTTVNNSGSIEATGFGPYSHAFGVYATGGSGGVSIDNSGDITATGSYSTGIYANAQGSGGGIVISNSGDITAGDAQTSYYGTGIHASTNYDNADITVSNSGNVSANSYYGSTGIEVVATGTGSAASISNTGSVSAYTTGNYATTGLVASADGDASIDNAGTVTAANGGNNSGAMALAFNGTASVTNSGDISVTTAPLFGYGYGIVASSQNGAALVDNSGTVTVSGGGPDSVYGVGFGIQASSLTGTTVTNSGSISVEGIYAYGIQARAGQGDVAINNGSTGYVLALSPIYTALGIVGVSTVGDVAIDNAGGVYALAAYDAIGVLSRARHGDASVNNSGNILAYSYLTTATGVFAKSNFGDAHVDNSGSIAAYSVNGDAIGIYGAGLDGGSVAISNSGDISAYSAYGNAIGISGTGLAGGSVAISNNGHILAVVGGAPTDVYGPQIGDGVGIQAAGQTVTVTNDGDITAMSYSNAIGVLAQAGDTAVVSNSGTILASGPSYTQSVSYSVLASGDAGASVSNTASGTIYASAGLRSYGVHAYSSAGEAAVHNAGSIAAVDSGSGGMGRAVGVWAYGDAGTVVINSGFIGASDVTEGYATGVLALSHGDVLVDNSGLITATANNSAVGVLLNSATVSTLKNTGTVRTHSATEGEIAVLGLEGVQSIQNYGQLFGAVVTNGGDDVFDNHSGGVWHVTNHATDFGTGDDAIHNFAGGLIALTDGAIHLGSSTAAGNSFVNDGTIKVSGDNLIDMGTGADDVVTLVPSLNALPLVNNGVIDFLDGLPDDTLAITGDLGGSGAINVDLDFAGQASDQLLVDGSIAMGATQTVNVAFDGLPPPASTPIAFAQVTGNSSAGSFVGGRVLGYGANNFLDLQVNVSSQINTANTSPDVFSVGVAVAGLNDTGALAASIASGAQSLVTSQIGTWRQRMGVWPEKTGHEAGLSPWIRAYSDRGEVDPAHAAGNFGQGGNFSYDQSNSGWELGMNANIQGGFNVGVLFNRSEADQHLRGPGIGSTHLLSSAFGLYSTWIAPNFYVDASYRWIGFDANLRSASGPRRSGASATAFNLEAGYTVWTLGDGLSITPQLQYTRTDVSDIDALQGDRGDFTAKGGVSERGRAGVAISKTIHGGNIIWTPYGSVNAVREFDGQTRFAVGDQFFGSTSTRGTSALVELGLGAQRGGVSVTGGVNWTDGGALNRVFGGQLVLRYTW